MKRRKVIAGGCLCGAVRFQINEPLYDLHYCHCRTCQKASGAPVVAGAFVARAALRFTCGTPKHFRSSPIVERGFCAECGTYLLYLPLIEEWLHWAIVTVASLDEPENFAPERHYGIESRISCYDTRDDLPGERYEEDFIKILAEGSIEERRAILDRFG